MSQSKDNRNHKKNKSLICQNCRGRHHKSNNKSPAIRETRSTQTDRPAERPEVEVSITDYTYNSSDSHCSSATALSRECSRHSGSSAPSAMPRSPVALRQSRSRVRSRARSVQPENAAAIRAQVAAGYESSSDSDNMEGRTVPSYDYLEGSRIVTSLTDLSLSDSDDEPNPTEGRLIVQYSNEDKLPKFL